MLLSPQTLQRIAHALESDGVTVVTCTPMGLLEEMEAAGSTCIVIDPTRLDETQLEAATALLQAAPRPVVIHPPLTPDGVRIGLALARDVSGLLAFQAAEEDFELLVQSILAAVHPSDATILLDALMPRLAVVPVKLRDAIVAMFTSDLGVVSPQALARRAVMSRRSVDRWLERAGITSTRLLVAAPPLLRALRLLRETSISFRRIARAAGYTSVRRFHDQAMALTQLTPTELRAGTVPLGEVLERIATTLQDHRIQVTTTVGGHNGRMRGRSSQSASPTGPDR